MDITSMLSGTSSSINLAELRKDMASRIDTDEDGRFSLEEFTSAASTEQADTAESVFASGDADGDGYLSEEEFAAMEPPPPPPPPQGGTAGGSLMSNDTLSELLSLLDESSSSAETDETSTATAETASPPVFSSETMSGEELLAQMQTQISKYFG